MDAKKFLEEARRMCKAQKGCAECALSALCDGEPIEWSLIDVGDVIEAVEKWSEEHPRRTRLMDVIEKYPHVSVVTIGGCKVPAFMPSILGYCGEKTCEACSIKGDPRLIACWAQEVENDETD